MTQLARCSHIDRRTNNDKCGQLRRNAVPDREALSRPTRPVGIPDHAPPGIQQRPARPQRSPVRPFARRMPGAPIRLTRADTEGGLLSLAEGGKIATVVARPGLSASIFCADRRNRNRGASGEALGWPPEGAPPGLRVGWITEDETLLGGAGQGAFGSLTADTVFARLEGDLQLGAWRPGVGAEWAACGRRSGAGSSRRARPWRPAHSRSVPAPYCRISAE